MCIPFREQLQAKDQRIAALEAQLAAKDKSITSLAEVCRVTEEHYDEYVAELKQELAEVNEAARITPMREHWINITVNPSGYTWGHIRDGEKTVFEFGANEPQPALEQIRAWAESQKEGAA
jgi:uncharacterized coiled-coil protein SlyX